jgi:flavin reductase (DIM6/NTAB) family NADH-FMN oxidoreductase RutF
MTIDGADLGYSGDGRFVTVYVRPSRYTKAFMDRHNSFSVSVLGDEWKEQKALCGTKSGRGHG